MSNLKLFSESIGSYQVDKGTEFIDDEKFMYIEGIFAQAEVPNKNGRIYPHDVLMNQVENYINTHVKNKTAIGELNHPDYPEPNLNFATHLITELKIVGNNVIGKARIIKNENGNKIEGLLRSGVRLGVSTRGLGTIREKNKDGYDIVDNSYIFKCVDVVGNPSAPDAMVNGIYENFEYIVEESGLLTRVQSNAIKKLNEEDRFQTLYKFMKQL